MKIRTLLKQKQTSREKKTKIAIYTCRPNHGEQCLDPRGGTFQGQSPAQSGEDPAIAASWAKLGHARECSPSNH